MKLKEKNQAIILRKGGLSIKKIAKELSVSKSSVSAWVRNIQLSREQKHILKKAGSRFELVEKRRLTRLSNEKKKRDLVMESAMKEIGKISENDLKLIGISLYWAEGRKKGKRVVSFSNSDPKMIGIMMRFFREICCVEEKKFRAHIHTFSHLNAKKCEKYWSNVTKIPLSQFYKTYCKPSVSGKQKMDSLPFGTLDIYVGDVNLFLRIMGLIEKINRLTLNPSL